MAGSIKWFKYTSNFGEVFALKRDESNMEAVNGSVGDYADSDTTPVYAIPRNVKPRMLRYQNAAGTIKREIVALTNAVFNAPPNPIDDEVSGESLRLVEYIGERVRAPLGFDTGLTDGDLT